MIFGGGVFKGWSEVKWSEVKWKLSQSCLPLCDPIDYTVHGILQAGLLEWVAIPFSRGSSQPRDSTWVSHIPGRVFTVWATWEDPPLIIEQHIKPVEVTNIYHPSIFTSPASHKSDPWASQKRFHVDVWVSWKPWSVTSRWWSFPLCSPRKGVSESQSDWQREERISRRSSHSFQFLNPCYTKRKLMLRPKHPFDNLCPSYLPLGQTSQNFFWRPKKFS